MELSIRVQPKARRNSVEVGDGKVSVRVTAAPESGKANGAVVELLAKRLGIAKGRVGIVKGHKTRDKRVLIEGMTESEVCSLLSGSVEV